jgi:hypothetical protein
MAQISQYARLGVNLSAAGALASQGTVTLSNSGGFTFGMDASANVTASAIASAFTAGIQSISAGTTQVTSGQVVFSNSNGISFGVNGQSMTMGGPALSFWHNSRWGGSQAGGQAQGPNTPWDIYLQVTSFPLPLNASRAEIMIAGSVPNTTVKGTFAIGVYTMNHSTASLATVISNTQTFETATTIFGSWKSITGVMNFTPGQYMIAVAFSIQSIATGAQSIWGDDGNLVVVLPINGDDNGTYWGDGYFRSSFSGTLPNSIHVTDVVKTYSSIGFPVQENLGGGQPYLQLVSS